MVIETAGFVVFRANLDAKSVLFLSAGIDDPGTTTVVVLKRQPASCSRVPSNWALASRSNVVTKVKLSMTEVRWRNPKSDVN